MDASNKLPKFARTKQAMKRTIIHTEDGSHTLYVPELEEHFHSVHGAIQESNHVFIQQGLLNCNSDEINLLEIGFGTGLNALLTLKSKANKKIRYFSIEKYPLTPGEYELLNYSNLIDATLNESFLKMHACEWSKSVEIVSGFELTKLQADFIHFDFSALPLFDLIYFDAFAPGKQPEMWDESLFSKIASQTAKGGIFTTYCAKGEVRRSLARCGYEMRRVAGPPGKKEMLYGEKNF